jgi:hypothetical protein
MLVLLSQSATQGWEWIQRVMRLCGQGLSEEDPGGGGGDFAKSDSETEQHMKIQENAIWKEVKNMTRMTDLGRGRD